ncbi:aminopeptidase N [Endozoicomonas sp. SCSIO W0465]|uniref:aminopeptidase N n=1 Tax=Endozoicomonas sp. SCSIO W0465 TaxID=2918516 RepID=UPI002074C944|nr:aminopeptidase N [Endozoicomonas sp. SCSIO W0465]USE38860.1 aminopeptidase N [Endozoicomonas sp. SCSIO W0465]
MKDSQPKAIFLKDYQAPDYWIDQTNLTFDLFEDHTLVTSVLSIHRNLDKKSEEKPDEQQEGRFPDLVLVGDDLELVSLEINDQPFTDFTVEEGFLKIVSPAEVFTLKTVCRIKPQENTSLEGLYKSNGMFCTQCEAEGFRKITWYLDRPDVMSRFITRITADKTAYPVLLSNGNDIDRGELDGGRHYVTWEDPFKKPSYLFALVAGDLQYVEDHFTTMSGREVTLRLFTEAHNIDQCDHAMVSLKKSMKWDEAVYGREYDLDIFMIVAVDHFNMGAMENKGLNIFNSACVLASPETATDARFQRVEAIVAHEYFHNWSGNRVTCRDWFQLSLKEGFTVFRDSEFSADMNSRGVKRIEDVNILRTAQFAEDAGPMAHPVIPESFIEISNFYTVTVYEKGAEVVRMIHGILGAKDFRKGSDLYFERHDGQAVTCEDFVKAMEDASGRDLGQFRRWYSQAGTPVLIVSDDYDEEKKQYRLTIEQSCPPTPGQKEKLPFHIPVRIGLLDGEGDDMPLNQAGDTDQVLDVKQEKEIFTFENIEERPLPSILRGFSAPVRVRYDYSRDDLLFLMEHDSDHFNRWDASQRLASGVIDEMVAALEQGRQCSPDERLIKAFGTIISDQSLDLAVKAKMLTLPSEASLAEQAVEIYPQFIHQARQQVKRAISETNKAVLEALWRSLSVDKPYRPESEDIAERTLKNISLSYLTSLDDRGMLALAEQQYHGASNMTDRFAALASVVNAGCQDKELIEEVLTDFLERYRDDTNVMDQWLSVQASSPSLGTLEHILALMQHEIFDATSPNKLRSVLGGFASNMKQFHRVDGLGYEFLTDQLLDLDKKNPQIASRLMTPLIRWRKFEPGCRERMRKALERIKATPGLSSDVYEVVTKSL